MDADEGCTVGCGAFVRPCLDERANPVDTCGVATGARAPRRSRACRDGGAVGLWFGSLSGVEPSDLTDLGLVGALPVSSIAALLLLTVSFCLSLRGPLREPLLLAHVVCLIAMLYGATSFIEEVPRTLTVWRHLGVVDYIVQHGSVDTMIDAYFNWPGFFVLGAFFTEVLGLQDPSSLANWSPLIFNALYLPPLLVIMRSFTNDRRLVWLSIWLFYATNWVGQDHLSP